MANEEIAFAFEYDNRVIQLPITPEDIEISYPGSNKTVNIIQLGQVNLLKTRNLATFSIKSWFPDEDWYPGIRTTGRFKKSKFYVRFFEKIRDDKKPCWFYIYGLKFNMQVSIESFTYSRKGGEHEDLYYTLSLKEYRPFSVRELPKVLQEDEDSESIETLDKKTPILEPAEITVGSTVVVNGTLHRDSYGSNPGKTLSNYTGIVNLINNKGTHPYHITDTSGGWLGWVNKEAIGLSSEQLTGIPIISRPSTTTNKSSDGLKRVTDNNGVPKLVNKNGEKIEKIDIANWKGSEKTKAMNEMLGVMKITTLNKMINEKAYDSYSSRIPKFYY